MNLPLSESEAVYFTLAIFSQILGNFYRVKIKDFMLLFGIRFQTMTMLFFLVYGLLL
jgi:hypothetical protein